MAMVGIVLKEVAASGGDGCAASRAGGRGTVRMRIKVAGAVTFSHYEGYLDVLLHFCFVCFSEMSRFV